MEIPIQSLLQGAMKRANITKQVTTAQIVAYGEQALEECAPEVGKEAKVIALQDQALVIACLSSATGHFVKRFEEDILEFVKRKLPSAVVRSVRIRIVQSFPNSSPHL